MDNSNIQDQLRHLQSASEPPFSGFPPRAPHVSRAPRQIILNVAQNQSPCRRRMHMQIALTIIAPAF